MFTITLSKPTVYRLFETHSSYDYWDDEEFLFYWEHGDMDYEFKDFFRWFADSFDASAHRVRDRSTSGERYKFIARFKTEKAATLFLLEWA